MRAILSFMSMRRLILAALAVLAASALPVPADQNDPRLGQLFEKLKAAPDHEAAHQIEATIWHIWSTAPSAGANLMLREGVRFMNEGKYEKALSDFDAVVELEPDFAEGWNKRATVRYLMGKYDGSVADIQRTLALEERHFGALSGLGLIYDALNEKKAALEAFRAALAINPHMPAIAEREKELAKEVEGRKL
jgi:tetratricopeptide (TPR) repeat protein